MHTLSSILESIYTLDESIQVAAIIKDVLDSHKLVIPDKVELPNAGEI
jgi:hypothetical protein